jgi:hypothetical protein
MGRGLDGYFDIRALALCGFEGPGRGGRNLRFLLRLSRLRLSPVSTSFRWLWRGGNTSSHSEQSR